MASNRKSASGWWPLLVAALASGILFWFGTGLHPIWLATWLAPVPVLFVSARLAPVPAYLLSSCAWMLGAFNEWHYLHRVVELPTFMVVLAVVAPSLIFGVAVLIWRMFLQCSAPVLAAIAFAAVWVTLEFCQQRMSPHSTFGNIAYSQVNCLPILQIASLAGVAGISFLLFAVPGLLAACVSVSVWHQRVRAFAVAAGLLVAVTFWGTWRLNSGSRAPSLKVGLAASDLRANISPRTLVEKQTLFRRYADEARRLASEGAAIVVLPEKIARVQDDLIPEVDALFKAAASFGAVIIAGVERWTPRTKLNEQRIYTPDGRMHGVYEKHHMLPAFESDLLPGTARVLLPVGSAKCGLTICKDMDFPALSREYGNEGTELQLVSAWDFKADGWLHARMAMMRGVESGFSIVRCARQGLLTVSDNRGRVLAERASDTAEFATLLATVPARHEYTLYDRWGDWFGWLNVALLLVLLPSLIIRGHGTTQRAGGYSNSETRTQSTSSMAGKFVLASGLPGHSPPTARFTNIKNG